VYMPAVTQTYYSAFEGAPTPDQLLVYMVTEVLKGTIDEQGIQPRDDGVEYPFEDDSGQGLSAVIQWGDGQLFYAFHAPAAEYEAVSTIVEDILAQLSAAPLVGTSAECYVSTDKSYGVPMRLGPGLNRGEYTSLTPKDGQVLVVGQATADDGSLWWQVDTAANPNVKELWVADSDVTMSGSCTSVGQVDAPPIIAPAPGYAPPVPTPSGGDTGPTTAGGEDTGSTAPAATDTSLIPRTGTWYLSASSEFLMSCEGGDTIRVPSNMEYVQGAVYLSTSGNGATLSLRDASGTLVFTRGGPGFYTAQDAPAPNMYSVFYIHVNGPTSAYGEVVVGFTDVPCSGTLPVSFTYRG
jgi:hypothetical protein